MQKITKKKWLSALAFVFAFAMALSVLVVFGSVTVGADVSYPKKSDIYIGNTDFYKGGDYYKNGDTDTFTGNASDYNAYYDSANGILKLKDFNCNEVNTDFFAVISCTSSYDMTIDLEGTSNIDLSIDRSGNNYAMRLNSDNTTFTGNGTLNINMVNAAASGRNYAIGGYGITIGDDVTINISTQGGNHQYGIYGVGGDLIIKDNASVTVTQNLYGDNSYLVGLYTYHGNISISSSNETEIVINGTAPDGDIYGVHADGPKEATNCCNIAMTNTTVTVTNNSNRGVFGILLGNDFYTNCPCGSVVINNSTVTFENCYPTKSSPPRMPMPRIP